MDIADRYGLLFLLLLRSADRFNDCAICLGSLFLNTPFSKSSALLCCITLPDHFLVDFVFFFAGVDFLVCLVAVFFFVAITLDFFINLLPEQTECIVWTKITKIIPFKKATCI